MNLQQLQEQLKAVTLPGGVETAESVAMLKSFAHEHGLMNIKLSNLTYVEDESPICQKLTSNGNVVTDELLAEMKLLSIKHRVIELYHIINNRVENELVDIKPLLLANKLEILLLRCVPTK